MSLYYLLISGRGTQQQPRRGPSPQSPRPPWPRQEGGPHWLASARLGPRAQAVISDTEPRTLDRTDPRFIYKEILRYDKVASDTVAPCQLASQTLTSWLRRRQLGGTLRLWRTAVLSALWAGDQENIQVLIWVSINHLWNYFSLQIPSNLNTVEAGGDRIFCFCFDMICH